MKKIFIAALVMATILGISSFSQADPTVYGNDRKCFSSGLLTADAVISARPADICGIILVPDGTNVCKLVLYNNPATNTGTVVAKGQVGAGEEGTGGYLPPFEIPADIGIYADHTTCEGFIVYFR